MNTKIFRLSEFKKLKRIILEKCGCRLSNRLLEQAFTRKSYSVQGGGESNEILELIGDSILNTYVTKALVERFGALNYDGKFTLRASEGDLSNAKKQIINNETLATIIDEWGIIDYLLVGKCDIDNQIYQQVKPKADLFEAILGAIAIETKWNSEKLDKTVKKMLSLESRIQDFANMQYRPENCSIENAITTLKEIAEKGYCSIPKYEFSDSNDLGYDKNGNPIWVCTCTIINEETAIQKQVWSCSKKDAKKAAAYLVLCEHLELQNEYGINGKYSCWEYLNEKLLPYHISKFY